MKLFIMTALIIGLQGLAFAGTPVEKMIPVDHVFGPAGFDSNDNTEVIVTGFLPNLCHKAPKASVSINGDEVSISMTSLYYHESSPFCPEMIVPFTQNVALGVLDKGDYKVKINSASPWEKQEEIKVAESTSNSIDDFTYAYVDYIDKESAPQGHVTLVGYNPSDCFELDEISYIHNGKDTYSVLPKMKQVSDFCPMKLTPFRVDWKVPTELNTTRVLLHVRTMEGKSVNSLFFPGIN